MYVYLIIEPLVGHRYWGGGDEDPITATDDFIWNKDFVPRMKRLIDDEAAEPITSQIKVAYFPPFTCDFLLCTNKDD